MTATAKKSTSTKLFLIIHSHVIKRRRLELALTREQLGSLAGVTARRIGQFESGERIGTKPSTARKLAVALSMPVEQLTEVQEG